MRIAVWGAGNIGTSVCYRLSALDGVSEIHWINRSLDEVELQSIDIEHGLAFAPSCHRVKPWGLEDAGSALDSADLLVLTLGAPVKKGQERQDVWLANLRVFREVVLEKIKQFRRPILIVTNPVDLIARLVFEEGATDEPESRARRVFGLGTIVDTARLRAAAGKYYVPVRPAREMTALAVGTHDDLVVALDGRERLGSDFEVHKKILELARLEAAEGAKRVKLANSDGTNRLASRNPVAEGVAQVVQAISRDSKAILTPSVRASEGLFYSVPCTIGAGGIEAQHVNELAPAEEAIEVGRVRLREMWAAATPTGAPTSGT